MRLCIGCKECCYVYTIPEMDKPRLQWCKHTCEAGCAMHDQNRPATAIARHGLGGFFKKAC